MFLEDLPLKLKDKKYVSYIHSLYYKDTCNVCVFWIIYNTHKKTIEKYGVSKPCGINNTKPSIHAEEIAIKLYTQDNNKNKKNIIVIWRWTKEGKIKTIYSCNSCVKLLNKYNIQDKICKFKSPK